MNAIEFSIVVILVGVCYIAGFWTGVFSERKKIKMEILELTTSIKDEESDEEERTDL